MDIGKINDSASTRYDTIDIAKGLAIILVVIGHFNGTFMPRAYEIMVDVIYMFHMPLFVFASGFLYQATWRPQPYRNFLAKKFRRLMVPYFTISILVIGIKLIVNGHLMLENPVTIKSFIEIFYLPAAGYFLWFLWALWWMMVIIPAFRTRWSRGALLALSVPLFFVAPKMPEIFCIKQFCSMLVFFAGGTVVADAMQAKNINKFSLPWQILSVGVFMALAWAVIMGLTTDMPEISALIVTLVLNIAGIAMSITISWWWKQWAHAKILTATYSIAAASYTIYLLHTTFEGFAKSILFKINWFDLQLPGVMAWLGAIIAAGCGVLIPWWLASKVLCRWKPTAFLFGLTYRKQG